jgi:hypothetical protein
MQEILAKRLAVKYSIQFLIKRFQMSHRIVRFKFQVLV